VKKVYTVWIKIDRTLPWIELKESYASESEAKRAARLAIKDIRTKIVNVSEKRKAIKALAAIRTIN